MQFPELSKTVVWISGLLVGFIPTQLGRYLEKRSDRKKALGNALSDLLEVRFNLIAHQEVVRLLKERMGMPEAAEIAVRAFIPQLLPKSQELHSRYDSAVTTIGNFDPILAYELRSKDIAGPLLQALFPVIASDANASAFARPIVHALEATAIEQLGFVVERVARKYSFKMRFRIRKVLASQNDVAKNGQFKGLIDKLMPMAASATAK